MQNPPTSLYPSTHVQSYPPAMFVHSENGKHGLESFAHSSISETMYQKRFTIVLIIFVLRLTKCKTRNWSLNNRFAGIVFVVTLSMNNRMRLPLERHFCSVLHKAELTSLKLWRFDIMQASAQELQFGCKRKFQPMNAFITYFYVFDQRSHNYIRGFGLIIYHAAAVKKLIATTIWYGKLGKIYIDCLRFSKTVDDAELRKKVCGQRDLNLSSSKSQNRKIVVKTN